MTIRVPAAALKLPRTMMGPEDSAGDVTPEVGDPVSFHVEGVVSSVGHGFCEVEPRFINGERPSNGEGAEPRNPAKSEEEVLMEAAAAADAGETEEEY